MAVVLDTRGYRVVPDSRVTPDLYLIVHTLLDAGKKANAFGRTCGQSPQVPVLAVILGKSNMAKPSYPATRTLYEPDMAEMLEAIHILMVRKRGPKRKGIPA